MPEKFHISPKSGQPQACEASVRPCPLGGAEAHYPTREAAQEAYEREHASELLPQGAKRAQGRRRPLGEAFQEAVVEAFERARSHARVFQDMDRVYQRDREKHPEFAERVAARAAQALEDLGVAQEALAKLSLELEASRPALERLREVDPVAYHGNPLRLTEVLLKRGVEDADPSGDHPSHHEGRLNPATSGGSGAAKLPEAGGSLVVLARPDGSRARVLSSQGERYPSLEEVLGAPARHRKEKAWAPDAETGGLFVVGYRDASGESHGWVPDKQVQFFVYSEQGEA